MVTPMLDPNHLQRVHVGEIKMKLPIPNFDEITGITDNRIKRKIRVKDVQKALEGFDLKEVYQQLIEQTDNMKPLTLDEFKKLENQWVFVREPRGYLYLMFKEDNKTPNNEASLYYIDMRPIPRFRNGKLEPVRDKDWESLKFQSYADLYASMMDWADIYLIKSNPLNSFMNWKGNPFIK